MPVPDFIRELRSKVGNALLQVPTVAVLVRDDAGRLLLVQDGDSGLWTCPGGLVEPFELPSDAAVREAWEEAGVHVQLVALVGVFGGELCQTHYRNGDKVAWVASVFTARIVGGTARADGDETTAIRYCTAAELVGLPMQPWIRMFIEAANTAGTGYFQPARWQPGELAAQ